MKDLRLAVLALLLSFSLTAFATPAITSLSPGSGAVGGSVTITGSGFGASQGSSTVSLNGTSATVTNWSDSSIIAIVPAGATSGLFSVTVNTQTANSSTFTVTALPSGWSDSDVGVVGISGSGSYATGTFTVKGAGQQIYGTSDGFHFVYQPVSGNVTMVARVVSVQGSSGYGSAGVMIRETLDAGSANVSTADWPAYSAIYFDMRTTAGGSTSAPGSASVTLPYWVKVVRNGSSFSSYVAPDGVNWTQVATTQTITMAQNVYLGLAVSSGNTSALATATFDNVSISASSASGPEILNLSATTGPVGSQVTINGSGFGSSQSGGLVTLGNVPVPVNSWSATAIGITIPAGTVSGPVVVFAAPTLNASNYVVFTITSQPLPGGWLDRDIGVLSASGSATYINGTFTVQGAGNQIYGTADAFHFVYQPMTGDGTIIARIASAQGTATYATAGVMIRETLDAKSTNAKTADYPAYNAIYFDTRLTTAGSTSSPGNLSVTLPYWIKVVRSGNSFTSYIAPDRVTWSQIGTAQTISMAQNVYVGLAVTSGSSSSVVTATFDNVSVSSASAPAPIINTVSATTGPIGGQVTISGANFGASQGNSVVLLNNAPVTINLWSDASIVITIPTGAISGPLQVSVAPSMNNSNFVVFTVTSQPLPSGWLDRDVGTMTASGSATYANGTFTVKGAGAQIYGTSDAFHFVYQPLSSDGTLVARVVSVSGYSSYASAGVMIRETMDSRSANAKTADWARI